MIVVFLPSALEDLDEAIGYFETQLEGFGQRFRRCVKNRLRLLSSFREHLQYSAKGIAYVKYCVFESTASYSGSNGSTSSFTASFACPVARVFGNLVLYDQQG